MTTSRFGMRVGVVLMSVGILALGTGCAAKRVASNSGDQSETMKGKADDSRRVENVKEESVVSVGSPLSTDGSSPKEPRGSVATRSTPEGRTSSSRSPGAADVPDMTSLGDIYFDFDQYNIRSDAQAILEGNSKWLRNEPGKALVIEGHCDERGTLAYNLVLGEKRAKSAKRYLEDLGIPASRIQTTSYGEVRPFCKDHNEDCWSKNRRAHFVIQ